jgi:predicted nucleic acid-binding protein
VDSVYIDSSCFLAIFNGEPKAAEVKALFRELRRERSRICTSIITIQEISVASFLFGQSKVDNYLKVDNFARIHGITKEIALTAARLEAEMLKRTQSKEQKAQTSPRRKMDCFDIATALETRCRCLYSLDERMLKCKGLIPENYALNFSQPVPKAPELFSQSSGFPVH